MNDQKTAKKGKMTLSEARDIAREARQALLEAEEENGHPIAVGSGDIQSFRDLVALRRAIDEAGLGALRETYTIAGTGALSYREQLLLFEYGKVQEMATHYNGVNTQIMTVASIITFVAWSMLLFTLRVDIPNVRIISIIFELAMFAVLSVFIHYMTINRSIFTLKCHRLAEIEAELNELDQHSRFQYARKTTRLFDPGGQTTEIFLYWFLSTLAIGVTLALQLPIQPGGNITDYVYILVTILPVFVMVWWGARCKAQVLRLIPGYKRRGLLHTAWLELGGYEPLGS